MIDIPVVRLLKYNPMAIIIDSMRNCLMYGKSPSYIALLIITAFSAVLIKTGYALISKYEGEYARMI